LNYLKDIPEKRGTGYSTEEINLLYRQNTFLLDPNSTIKKMEDLLKLRAQFGDAELTYLGVPSPEGGIPIIGMGNSCLSITADSPVKEGAWEFLRYIVYEEQIHFSNTSNKRLPVTKSNIRWQAEREGEYFFVFALDTMLSKAHPWDGVNVPEYDTAKNIGISISEEDVEFILDILDSHSASVTIPSHKTVNSLIDEELEAFYAGNVTAEEAARRIQSRVSIYLAEQS